MPSLIQSDLQTNEHTTNYWLTPSISSPVQHTHTSRCTQETLRRKKRPSERRHFFLPHRSTHRHTYHARHYLSYFFFTLKKRWLTIDVFRQREDGREKCIHHRSLSERLSKHISTKERSFIIKKQGKMSAVFSLLLLHTYQSKFQSIESIRDDEHVFV